MSGVSRRRKAKSRAKRARLASGSEMALREGRAVEREESTAAAYRQFLDGTARFAGIGVSPMRIGSADIAFTAPPGEMPTVELGGTGLFGINASTYDLWSGNAFSFPEGPGKTIPIRLAGTRARHYRLRCEVEVLKDQWHIAGAWPWLDGRRCVRKPWELRFEDLVTAATRMGRENVARRYPPMRVTDVNRDTGTITLAAELGALDVTINPMATVTPSNVVIDPPVQPKSRRPAFIPVRRLDGRR